MLLSCISRCAVFAWMQESNRASRADSREQEEEGGPEVLQQQSVQSGGNRRVREEKRQSSKRDEESAFSGQRRPADLISFNAGRFSQIGRAGRWRPFWTILTEMTEKLSRVVVLRQDGGISPGTDSGFVGSECSHQIWAANHDPCQQRASKR